MHVILADALGMCFGVRDALALARLLQNPTQITVRGQLVHNPLVNRELSLRGFALAPEEAAEIPSTPAVLITAHGASHRTRDRLLAAGKTVIDTTCPLVRKAHHAALELDRLGFHVLVIGQPGHVEVLGLTGDLASCDVIPSVKDVQAWTFPNLGVIAQTTTIQRDAHEILDRIRRLNPHAHIRFINTICQPTRDRQDALENLLDHVDILVVIGGRNSNNTRRLVQRALERRVPALHIEHAADLDPSCFTPGLTAGLTAGTSTLPETIEAVRRKLEAMHMDNSQSSVHINAVSSQHP